MGASFKSFFTATPYPKVSLLHSTPTFHITCNAAINSFEELVDTLSWQGTGCIASAGLKLLTWWQVAGAQLSWQGTGCIAPTLLAWWLGSGSSAGQLLSFTAWQWPLPMCRLLFL